MIIFTQYYHCFVLDLYDRMRSNEKAEEFQEVDDIENEAKR